MKYHRIAIVALLLLIFVGCASANPFSAWTSANGCWTATNDTYMLTMWNISGTTSYTIPSGVDTIYYLIVGGGGGGSGSYYGGGGGAGGFLTATLSVTPGNVVSVRVGQGGIAGDVDAQGSNGGNSSFSDIDAFGGGGGGNGLGTPAGFSGGSGGGGGYNNGIGGLGIAGQGFAGANGGSTGTRGAGGGGGANNTPLITADGNGGMGGNGTTSSITGSIVSYAGGGGGGAYDLIGGAAFEGGGRGGDGTTNNCQNGTVNTGGGGGGTSGSTATGPGCYGGSGIVIIRYQIPSTLPTANFTWSPTTGSAPLNVSFTDTSSGFGITIWNWSFGDGGSSLNQNPFHTFASAGNFSVSLNVTNSTGSNVVSHTIRVNASTVMIPDFVANTTSAFAPAAIAFTDLTSGTPTTWNWTFGDGNTSTQQNPVHVYGFTGMFTVQLNVTNITSSESVTKTNYINISQAFTGYTQHDFLISHLYPVTVYVRDINTNNLITSAIVVDQTGFALPGSGTGAFAWSYPYGLVSFTANATGYTTLTRQEAILDVTTVTMLLTPLSSPTPVQNTWWTPHTVQVVVMDTAYQNRLTNVYVNASFNESAMPETWVEQLYGIQQTVGLQMTNPILYLQGYTGDDGTLTTTMLGSLKYDIYLTAPQYGLNRYFVQAYPSDSMLNIYVPTNTSQLPIAGNSSYAQTSGTRVYVTEPNISYVTMNIDYQDLSGLTQMVNETWMFSNNGTIVQFISIPNPGTSLIPNNYTVQNIRGVQYWWGYNATRAL